MDKRIAREVADVDLVVGGHSHSFLFTGDPPSNDIPLGPYPTLVKQNSGRTVPVVQAFWGTKYLGHIKLNFTKHGGLKSWAGAPILLDSNYERGKTRINTVCISTLKIRKISY